MGEPGLFGRVFALTANEFAARKIRGSISGRQSEIGEIEFGTDDRRFKSEERSTIPKGLYQPNRVAPRAIGKDESAVEEIGRC